MPRKKQDRNIGKARELRREMTLPEVLLWQRLRGVEIKFRRQHPVGTYVLDFYCPAAKLGIEIDGIAHDMGDNPQRDEMRNAWLAERGIKLLRIPASEVLKSADDVAEAIVRACDQKSSLFSRSANGEVADAKRLTEG